MKLKEYNPKNEKELHQIIKENLYQLNLSLIKYEFSHESLIPDFLCIDNGVFPTIINDV